MLYHLPAERDVQGVMTIYSDDHIFVFENSLLPESPPQAEIFEKSYLREAIFLIKMIAFYDFRGNYFFR